MRVRSGLRVRDFEVARLREDAAVPRARDFDAGLARELGFAFGLGMALAGVVDFAGVDAADCAGVVDWPGVAAFGGSAGFVSVGFWAVSVVMFVSSVSGA